MPNFPFGIEFYLPNFPIIQQISNYRAGGCAIKRLRKKEKKADGKK